MDERQSRTADGKVETVHSTAARPARDSQRYVRIRVTEEEGAKLWDTIADNEWTGEYLGKNTFVFTESQLHTIKAARISFQVLED